MHVFIFISSEVAVLCHYFTEKLEMYAHLEWTF